MIFVATRDGDERQIESADDQSLMEALRDGGIDELLAICGGCLSCATCHVYVEPAFLGLLAPMSEDEDELLQSAFNRTANSRLSCQVNMSEKLESIRVKIAPDE